tara:strand:+ start:1063 stop:3162 length:2100 start_codon:yes stop_codon:yes gene_type:complete
MANYSKKTENKKEIVDETKHLFDLYSQKRRTWADHAQEDKEFRLGKQWSLEQKETLEARGQAPVVVNRIHPAVETAKALLTANRPGFRVSPREDSDNKVAQVFNSLLEYCWQISQGETVLRQVVDDYYVTGVGYMLCYQDPLKDDGKGEVCFKDIDPLDVYVDPNSRDRLYDDAESIIISRLFTREQAKSMYPMYKKAIKNAASDQKSDMPVTTRDDNDQTTWPEDVMTREDTDYIRGYERYYKIIVDKFRIFETFSGKEYLFNEMEFESYIQRPVWIVNNKPIFRQEVISKLSSQGMMPRESSIPELIEMGIIKMVKVQVQRVKQCIIMGDKYLYSRELPTEHYPLVPFMNLHTRTPYPMSDVRLVKNLQEYINKIRSLVIAHATTSTNAKVLIPEGSVDMKEFEEKWAMPGVGIAVDFSEGQPVTVQPTPLPNELYKNEADAKQDIDHQLGLYELMMGNSGAAPQTYKATVAIDEFGQRKIKSKQADIEGGLRRIAEVAIPMMQQLYKTEKVFRIANPNNTTSKYMINKKMVDDKTGEINKFNDITIGKYDVIVVTGSTLPTNRYAQLELYMDAYKNGVIDRQEVLKKTEVFDMEGVMERTDAIGKMEGQIKQQQEELKKLRGDLQTRDREAVALRKKVEVEKFKSNLDKVSNKAQASGTVFEKRLNDAISSISKEIKSEKTDSTSKKEQSTKKRSK